MILRDQPPIAHFMRLHRTLRQRHMIYMVSMRKRVLRNVLDLSRSAAVLALRARRSWPNDGK